MQSAVPTPGAMLAVGRGEAVGSAPATGSSPKTAMARPMVMRDSMKQPANAGYSDPARVVLHLLSERVSEPGPASRRRRLFRGCLRFGLANDRRRAS